MFVVVAEVDVVDSEMSCELYMVEKCGEIRTSHAIPVMAEAANVAYLMARRCLHKPPFAAFPFVAVRLLLPEFSVGAKIPPLLILPESRLRSKFTLCKGENKSLPLLLSSNVAIPGVASVEGLKVRSVCVELAAVTVALLVLLIWLLADMIEAPPMLAGGGALVHSISQVVLHLLICGAGRIRMARDGREKIPEPG